MIYDLAIIGMGPAGLEAAEIALKNNLKVIVFEKNKLGGTCLNIGCIPTKSILHSANLLAEIKNAKNLGINCENVSFDMEQIIKRKDEIVQKFNKTLNLVLSKKLDIINAEAQIVIDNEDIYISVDDNYYQAKNIIVATGSKPIELPNLKFNGQNIISSDDILSMTNLPKSIAIVGSGAIGLEIATFLNAFDVEVVLVEKAPSLCPKMDIDIQKRIERNLKQNKIKYYKDDFIVEYSNGVVKLNSAIEFEAQKVLVAVGRSAILPEIKLLQYDKKLDIKINDDLTCDIDNIYFTGDVTNRTMLAHSASYQAKMVINRILGKNELKPKNIPAVIYTTPEIASVGLNEQDIKDKDGYIIKKMLLSSIAKSWCDNATDGMVKVIIKDNKLVGAHIVSKNASILISIFNILIDKKVDIDEINEMIFPHPCFSEVVQGVLKSE